MRKDNVIKLRSPKGTIRDVETSIPPTLKMPVIVDSITFNGLSTDHERARIIMNYPDGRFLSVQDTVRSVWTCSYTEGFPKRYLVELSVGREKLPPYSVSNFEELPPVIRHELAALFLLYTSRSSLLGDNTAERWISGPRPEASEEEVKAKVTAISSTKKMTSAESTKGGITSEYSQLAIFSLALYGIYSLVIQFL